MNVSLIYALMLLMTGASYLVAETAVTGEFIMSFVLLTVFIKGHWVISDFMKLKRCALTWRFIMHGWLTLIVLFIAIFTI